MQSITLRARVDQDGFLKVRLPEMIDQEVEAIVVYQARPQPSPQSNALGRFYGCLQDDSFVRQPQPEQPERESWV